ncbi:MAG: hypothetical protein HUK16_09955 [Bacteroidales bacterium]|nr:hypothetical protein [Bacteroidales bacterium]
MLTKPSKYVLFAMLMAFLSSCSIEKQMGKQFVEQSQGARMAVYFPEKAKASNQYSTQYQTYSKVLDDFNQDMFLDVMYNAFAEAMDDYNVEIYLPDDPDNVKVDSANWLVLLSNVEITGSMIRYDDVLFDDYYQTVKSYPLNHVNIASWFELNDGEWLPVQFGEINLMDGFRSSVEGFSSNNYRFEIDTLKLDDVYNAAVFLGKTYAGYVYDCFMNRYISKRLDEMESVRSFFVHYDPYKRSLKAVSTDSEDKFVEVGK